MDGKEITETVDALAAWERQADEMAAKALKPDPQPVRHERILTLILGPPAAGKSGIANEIVIARGAAILDSDGIKKSLPEYDKGPGASAVHEDRLFWPVCWAPV